MFPGLILVGQALQKHMNYGVIVIGCKFLFVLPSASSDVTVFLGLLMLTYSGGMYVFGVMLAAVAITAYALDSFPTASQEVAGFLNFARVIGGFTVGYYQQPWGARDGYSASFGVQAAIVGVAVVIIVILQKFGGTLRAKGRPIPH